MDPEEFQVRFRSSLPVVPAGIEAELNLGEFVSFQGSELTNAPLSEADKSFLLIAGLPVHAAPFLSFEAYDQKEQNLRCEHLPAQASGFPIGFNGSGDIIAIESPSGNVVYFNHDNHNQRIFINSSLAQFATSLCIFQECMHLKAMTECTARIREIDEAAIVNSAMWPCEIACDLEMQASGVKQRHGRENF